MRWSKSAGKIPLRAPARRMGQQAEAPWKPTGRGSQGRRRSGQAAGGARGPPGRIRGRSPAGDAQGGIGGWWAGATGRHGDSAELFLRRPTVARWTDARQRRCAGQRPARRCCGHGQLAPSRPLAAFQAGKSRSREALEHQGARPAQQQGRQPAARPGRRDDLPLSVRVPSPTTALAPTPYQGSYDVPGHPRPGWLLVRQQFESGHYHHHHGAGVQLASRQITLAGPSPSDDGLLALAGIRSNGVNTSSSVVQHHGWNGTHGRIRRDDELWQPAQPERRQPGGEICGATWRSATSPAGNLSVTNVGAGNLTQVAG